MFRTTLRPRPLRHSPCAHIVLRRLQTHRTAAHCVQWLCCSGLTSLPKELMLEACHKVPPQLCHCYLQNRNTCKEVVEAITRRAEVQVAQPLPALAPLAEISNMAKSYHSDSVSGYPD